MAGKQTVLPEEIQRARLGLDLRVPTVDHGDATVLEIARAWRAYATRIERYAANLIVELGGKNAD